MANHRKIKWDLEVNVDKSSLNTLSEELRKVRFQAEGAKLKGNLTEDLKEAAEAARQLSEILDSSWNNKLNQLDLGKVNRQVKETYGSVEILKNKLESSGNAGATAYNHFASQVLNTNIQIKKSSEFLDRLSTTFTNVARYSISTSVFNKMTGSLQNAYNYSAKLDKSLNNIRIVSGESAENMEKFAKQANQAAQQMGSTTRDYTDAALIYYQQGLSQEEVIDRTNTTIKMANVLGENADEVSDYMTAIWNNFDDGSKSLEYYGDVITKLGASTSSSAEEIAEGLSKFASIGNTVGLSYEYATSALATVVANTRQSADVVGTAFKTLFARIQDLELGNTLDDGTTLGTYSQALEKIGVNIKDNQGALRDMDDILNDIGAKWKTLSADTKVATAQAVAGTRQYSQMMALMDNWDDFQTNLNTANNSLGALNEQQEIYMESIAAHLQKMSTAAEETYDILFDTKAVNSMADAVTGLIQVFNTFLKGLGGGLNDFTYFGSVLMNVFNKQIGGAIERQIQNIQTMQNNLSKAELAANIRQQHAAKGDSVSEAQLNAEIEAADMAQPYTKSMTTEQAQELLKLQQQIGEKAKEKAEYEEQYKKIATEILGIQDTSNITEETFIRGMKEKEQEIDHIQEGIEKVNNNIATYNKLINTGVKENTKDYQTLETLIRSIRTNISQGIEDPIQKEELLNKLRDRVKLSQTDADKITQKRQAEIDKKTSEWENISGGQDKYNERNFRQQDFEKVKKAYSDALEPIKQQQVISEGIKGISTLATAWVTFSGVFQTVADEEATTGEKAERIFSTLLVNLPMVLMNLSSIKSILPTITIGVENLAIAMGVEGATAGMGFGAAISGILSVAWPFVAIIGTISIALYALVKAYNADSDAAREAQKSVEELSTTYEECKQKVEELKNAMSQYNEAAESLKGLKENTEEFKDALEDANEEAKKLIEKYELFDDYSYDEKGLIKIDEDALEDALKQAENTTSKVRDSLLLAQMSSSQADLKLQRTNFSRKVGMLSNSQGRQKGIDGQYYSTGYLEGTTYQSKERTSESVQLDDESISIIINGLNKIRESNQLEYDMLFAEGNEKTLKNTILAFEDITPAIKENIDQILKQTDALKALTDNTNSAAEKMGYISGEIIGGVIEDKYAKQFENFATKDGKINQALAKNLQNAMTTLVKNKEEDKENGLQDKIKNATVEAQKVKNTGDLQKYYPDVKNDVDLIKTYAAEIKGIDWDTINNHVTIKDQLGKGTMTTDEGKVLIENKNDEQMRKELAAKKAVDNLKADYERDNKEFNDNLAKSLQDLAVKASEFGSKYGTDFTNGILTGIANGSQKFDFSSIFGEIIDPDAVPQLLNMSTKDLIAKLELTEEDLANYGFMGEEAAKRFADAFKAGFEGYQWDMDTAISAAMSKRDEEIDALGLTKSKTEKYKEEIQDYGKYIMRIAEDSEDFADALDKDAESAVVVAQSIVEMNKGIDALADGFEEWSDVLKKSSKESQEYADALGGIQAALSQVYGVEQDYISNDFVTSHMKEIEQIAKGSESAIESLRQALAEDIIVNIAVYNGLDETTQSNLINMIHELEATIPDIKVGTEIDMDDETYADFIKTMQDIIDTAHLTAEQANALFNTIGFDTTFATDEIDMPQKVPEYVTETIPEGISFTEDGKPMVKTRTRTYQDGVYEATGKMTVMAMETSADGEAKVPQIKSITKKSTGSMNNYSSKNKGGKSPGSKKSGGGGGGSGSKPKEPDKQEALKDEKDPYHDIDIRIKQISTDLEKLNKQQSKFFGQKLINNLNEQWNLLNKQIDAAKVKISIARNEMKKFQEKLSMKGVSFNTDGTISNYTQAYNEQLNYVNSIISKYNSMSAEEQEKYKETVEKAKEDFENFKKNIEEYDKTVTDIIPGLEADIQEAINKQIEINITKFDMEIEIRLNMAEAERNWNEFKKKVIDGIKDTDILGNAKAELQDFFSYYKKSGEGIIQVNTKHVEDTLAELRQMDSTGWSQAYGDNRTAALEDLKKYNDQLMTDLESMVDLVDKIKESYLDMMDEAAEKFKDQLDLYFQISDLIEHDMNVIQLVYGDESYEKLAKYYEKQEDNFNNQLDFQRQQVDFWQKQMDTLEEGSDEWKKAKEEWMSAVEEWNKTVEDAIKNLQDKYLNTINQIFQELNNKVTAGKGLDYVNEQWNLINKNAEQYLDSINSVYAVQQLQKKYQDAIDTTDNIAQQRKLKTLMNEQIKALQEKDKLTQYDVDRAELKYQIALKQIALEEAQQNKSTMRLRRDSQGNYSYQYTADNDEINSIQQEVSDLYNQLYNMDIDKYKDNLDQIYSVWEEFQEKMAEAAQINDPEARAEKELLLKEQYGELINGLVEQNEDIRNNIYESTFLELADLYDTDYAAFATLTKDKQDLLVGGMIPQWNSGVQQMADAFAGENGFYGVCKDAFEKLDNATKDYEGSLKNLQDSAGQDFSEIGNGLDNVINQTQNLLSGNRELIDSYMNQLDAVRSVINELEGLVAEYKAAETAAKAATAAAYGYWQAQQRQAASAASNQYNGGSSNSSNSSINSNSSYSGSENSGGSGSGDGDGILSVGDTATFSGKYYYDSFGTTPAGSRYSGVANGIVIDKVNNNPYGIHIHSADGKFGDLGWVKRSQLTGYDTGGYTGNWGDNSGRLALLHKKELVLNSEDTENMLNMLKIMRGVTQSIDSNMLSRMAEMFSGASVANMGVAAGNDTLEQNVHIEANFPNVTKSDEIEKAIHNLNNIASQRINRNRG